MEAGGCDAHVMVALCGVRSSVVLGVQMCHLSLGSCSNVLLQNLASPPFQDTLEDTEEPSRINIQVQIFLYVMVVVCSAKI